jgi:hypothetical protein
MVTPGDRWAEKTLTLFKEEKGEKGDRWMGG